MKERSKIFDENYEGYCRQIENVNLPAISARLDCRVENGTAYIPFFDQTFQVSGSGILDMNNDRADYVTSVILAKYILLCPDQLHLDSDWCTFRDFKKESHFTNTNFFNTETTGRIIKHFSGQMDNLMKACEKTGGKVEELGLAYDLSVSFKALPRMTLLLLMNDADEDFSADCKVLFQKQGEYYLDPESLAMTSGLLANKLIQAYNRLKGENNG